MSVTDNGTDWAIDDSGYLEIYHMNEQYPLSLTVRDLDEMSKALVTWKEEEEERNHQRELKQSQKDYEQYLILKERFEK